MGERLFLVDLPEDRHLVTDRSRAPIEHSGRYARDLFGKRQLRSWENADRHARIFRCREPSRACAKVACRKFVANPRGSRHDVKKTVITHLGTPYLGKPPSQNILSHSLS